MTSYSTNEFKSGLKVMLEGDPCSIVENEFVKPGKGQAFNRVKLRNLKTGRVMERTYKSGESVEAADVVELEVGEERPGVALSAACLVDEQLQSPLLRWTERCQFLAVAFAQAFDEAVERRVHASESALVRRDRLRAVDEDPVDLRSVLLRHRVPCG